MISRNLLMIIGCITVIAAFAVIDYTKSSEKTLVIEVSTVPSVPFDKLYHDGADLQTTVIENPFVFSRMYNFDRDQIVCLYNSETGKGARSYSSYDHRDRWGRSGGSFRAFEISAKGVEQVVLKTRPLMEAHWGNIHLLDYDKVLIIDKGGARDLTKICNSIDDETISKAEEIDILMDISKCEVFVGTERHECYARIGDESSCEGITTTVMGVEQDHVEYICYQDIAAYKNDASICENVARRYRDACYVNVVGLENWEPSDAGNYSSALGEIREGGACCIAKAQSFKPEKVALKGISVWMGKGHEAPDLLVSLRESIDGREITNVTIPASEISEEEGWVSADLNEIIAWDEEYWIVWSIPECDSYRQLEAAEYAYAFNGSENNDFKTLSKWVNGTSYAWESMPSDYLVIIEYGFKNGFKIEYG